MICNWSVPVGGFASHCPLQAQLGFWKAFKNVSVQLCRLPWSCAGQFNLDLKAGVLFSKKVWNDKHKCASRESRECTNSIFRFSLVPWWTISGMQQVLEGLECWGQEVCVCLCLVGFLFSFLYLFSWRCRGRNRGGRSHTALTFWNSHFSRWNANRNLHNKNRVKEREKENRPYRTHNSSEYSEVGIGSRDCLRQWLFVSIYFNMQILILILILELVTLILELCC